SIPLGASAVTDMVAAFRRSLDVDMTEDLNKLDASGRKRELFDLGRAHQLYASLIGPVEALVKDKRHLIIVPSGALTALPFHLLVTEKPAVSTPTANGTFTQADA